MNRSAFKNSNNNRSQIGNMNRCVRNLTESPTNHVKSVSAEIHWNRHRYGPNPSLRSGPEPYITVKWDLAWDGSKWDRNALDSLFKGETVRIYYMMQRWSSDLHNCFARMDHDHIEVAELRIDSLALYPPYGFGTSYPIVKYTTVTSFFLMLLPLSLS